jgi:hypothetical protein
MIVTSLTSNIAMEIVSTTKWELTDFIKNGSCCEYISFTHYAFFYNYLTNGESQYHRVETKCHLCDYKPDRNFAGIGSIYLLNNGVGDSHILIVESYNKIRGKEIPVLKTVPNHPSLSRMICLCPNHIKGYFPFNQTSANKIPDKPIYTQLSLF